MNGMVIKMAEFKDGMLLTKIFSEHEYVMAQMWGDSGDNWWWPIVIFDLDTGLCKIDVVGKLQNCHIDDFARLEVDGEIIIQDRFYEWYEENEYV